MHRKSIVYKIHLVISICIVVPVALVYGFKPNMLLDIQPQTTDALTVFKAIMGLYLGFATLWTLGLFKDMYLKPALVSHLIFMFGLAFGRLTGIVLDGMPSTLLFYGTFGEFLLGIYSAWVLTSF